MLFRPGPAVVVLQHHLNADPSMLRSNQRVGDLRKCQFLNGHQHFLLGRIDLCDQLFLEVVAVTQAAVQRIAVSPAVSMIEVQLEVLR